MKKETEKQRFQMSFFGRNPELWGEKCKEGRKLKAAPEYTAISVCTETEVYRNNLPIDGAQVSKRLTTADRKF